MHNYFLLCPEAIEKKEYFETTTRLKRKKKKIPAHPHEEKKVD